MIRSKIQIIANYDYVTGIINRPAFSILLDQKIKNFMRNNKYFYLMAFSIDNFNVIINKNSIEKGNLILRKITEYIRLNIRTTDIFGRIEKNIFSMIFEDKTDDLAGEFMEKLKFLIEDYNFESDVKINISLGLTRVKLHDTVLTILERAQKAMKKAEQAQVNKLVIHYE
jgi:diguanylate cyclase (GGDEF)-like protein